MKKTYYNPKQHGVGNVAENLLLVAEALLALYKFIRDQLRK